MLLRAPRPPRPSSRLFWVAFVLTITTLAHGQLADAPPAGAAPSGWQWPLERSRQLSRAFLAPATEFGPGHRGIDLPAAVGERLVAPARVRVAFAGRVVDRDVVTLDAGGRWLVTFDGATSTLEVGAVVEAQHTLTLRGASMRCDYGPPGTLPSTDQEHGHVGGAS